MNKSVHKIRFIDAWRIGENESWLSDMAEKGLHLNKYGRILARFDRGEPQKYRYRIDVSFSELTDEYRTLFAESGWDFVCRTDMFNIFRSLHTSNAPELHTDPAEQSFTLSKLNRRLILTAVLYFVVLSLIFVSLYFTFSIGRTPVIQLIEGSGLAMLFIIPIYLWLAAISLQASFSIKKLMRTMRFGYPINHKANWKKHKYFGIFASVISMSLAMVYIFIPTMQLIHMHTQTLPTVNNNQTILRLNDIENNVNLERMTFDTNNNIDWGNRVAFKWSPLAPILLTVRENGIIKGITWPDTKSEYSPSLEYRLYKLRFTSMANILMSDTTKLMDSWYQIHNETPDTTEIKNSGLDKLLVRESGKYREVFAHKKHYVAYIRYYGQQSIETVKNAVIKLFEGL